MRLDKFLVESSIGTRKRVMEYIRDGLVKVNGITVTEVAAEINHRKDNIEFKNKEINLNKKYFMFHKPGGCVTARSDAETKTVMEYFHKENMEGVFHVGRLDKDTEGLLLFTNDGEFNTALMSPEKDVEKKYFFWALGKISDDAINKLREGISIGKDEPITKPAEIEIVKEGTYGELKDQLQEIKAYNFKGNYPNQKLTAGYLTISEGRKHQVKRMLKSVGCYVIYLKRVAIGELPLDEDLKLGEYRHLKKWEIKLLLNNKGKDISSTMK